MYLLIRNEYTKEALGIMQQVKRAENDPGRCPVSECSCLKSDLEYIVGRNVGRTSWCIEEITQAEYETYRDLHELKMLV